MGRLQRRRTPGEEQRATTLELFYDLVFVFAITQISHLLLHDLSWRGLGKAAVALLVVWWAWNYTTWVTNELDPDSPVVRVVLIAIMLASLLMAVAIPQAFGSRALLFVGSYVGIQVGRHLFLTFVADPGRERERAGRILIWLSTAGALWLAGGFAPGPARVGLWLAALAIDYAGPVAFYRVPGMRRLPAATWDVESAHFAERFQLFMIIALGESIVLIGATTARLGLSLTRVTAFGLAFLVTAALWWLYFTYVAEIAQRRLELSDERTKLARDAYTYLHVVMVAGIILAAVGAELVIAHPTAALTPGRIAAVVAGPAVYLIGLALFRLRMAGSVAPKRLLGAAGCGAAGAIGAAVPGIAVEALVLASLTAVIASEVIAGLRRRARGEPSPLERLEAAAG